MNRVVIDGSRLPTRLAKEVQEAIQAARTTQECVDIRCSLSVSSDAGDDICLLLKPGATDPFVDTYAVVEIVHQKLRQHGLRVTEVIVIPSRVLRSTRVMVQHYDILNALATYPRVHLPDQARYRFHELFGVNPAEVCTLGGYEILERYPKMTPVLLEEAWEGQQQHELATSAFAARIELEHDEVFVLNGFVPRLMDMYERPESVVVIYALRGPICWSETRRLLLGSPDPARADPSSLRNELFSRREQLGISDIRLGWNAVHLSAGPEEARVELCRFRQLAVSAPSVRQPINDTHYKDIAVRRIDSAEVIFVLNNPLRNARVLT